PAGRRDVLPAPALIEAVGQVADDGAILRGDEDDVEFAVLAVAARDGDEIARRRRLRRQGLNEGRLLRIRREIAAVVRRPLLVPERLEALLQVLVELLVELLTFDLERFFLRILA